MSILRHFPEDGDVRCRNMQVVYGVYNILSYTYVHILVLISYLITACLYCTL
jgi:hypothetical protein